MEASGTDLSMEMGWRHTLPGGWGGGGHLESEWVAGGGTQSRKEYRRCPDCHGALAVTSKNCLKEGLSSHYECSKEAVKLAYIIIWILHQMTNVCTQRCSKNK